MSCEYLQQQQRMERRFMPGAAWDVTSYLSRKIRRPDKTAPGLDCVITRRERSSQAVNSTVLLFIQILVINKDSKLSLKARSFRINIGGLIYFFVLWSFEVTCCGDGSIVCLL